MLIHCFILQGWVHLKLMEKANEERLNSKPSDLDEEGETNRSRVGAAIERLEGNLRR